MGIPKEEAEKIPAIDVTGAMLGLTKKVAGEVIKKAPQTIKAFGEEAISGAKQIVGKAKELISPKIEQISPKIVPELEPLAQEARKFKTEDEFFAKVYQDVQKTGKITGTDLEVREFARVMNPETLGKGIVRETGGWFDDVRKFYRQATEVVKPQAISKELEPLAIDARKYKSAEEFVKANRPVFRGTTIEEARITGFLKQATKQTKQQIAPEKIERGFITSVKEAYPEIKVAGQSVPRSTDRLAIKAKNLIKDDIMAAEAIARTGTDDDAVAIAAELIKHYGDEAGKVTNAATKSALYDRAADIANETARKLTEQGRSVQAASIL